jgi:DNA-binding PucR family transcriptional regulator
MNLRGSLFMYEELFFYDMLGNFQKEKDKTVFCHPALKILKDYDQQKGTHLYETLAAYIRNGFNQADTAIELKLHRNTLAYRRTRIEELTGVDLDNTDERFFLRCSYNMNTFLQDSTENSI